MVESYLRVSGDAIKDPTRKRRHTSAPGDDEMAMEFATENDMDYVYDVYHREPTSTATAPDASAPDIGLIVVDSDDEKLFGLEDDEEDSDYVLTDDEDSNAEDFYKNDYPDEDYSSDYTHAADDDVEEEEAAWHLRQQLAEENGDEAAQVGYDENDYPDTYIGRTISDGEGNDDDDYNCSSTNNYNEGGYLGEDEDMEHYRDRIFEDLQRQIEKRKSISSHLKKQ